MAFKTLLVHLTGTQANEQLIEYASKFAIERDAHLDVLCHGVDQMTAGFHYGAVDPMMLQQSMKLALEEAQALKQSARDALDAYPVRFGLEAIINPGGTLGRQVALRSRFSDLVVLGSPYSATRRPEDVTVFESALLNVGTPVVMLPDGVRADPTPGIVVVAWNESPEALAAIRAALPLLRSAQQVRVTVIDPPRHGPDRSDPGGPVSVFLARHGVRAEIDVLGKSLPRISDVLLRHAADKNADMIVMGAYGHSRFREAVLGGATRDMLEAAPVPVFLKH